MVDVYLTAFNNGLWHKYANLDIRVILRPTVVFSHCPVITVRVLLKSVLTPEKQTGVYRDACYLKTYLILVPF